jgi:hypothetical protein
MMHSLCLSLSLSLSLSHTHTHTHTHTHLIEVPTGSNKGRSSGIIIGAAVGGSVLLSLLVLAGVYAFHQKKRAERAIEQNNPFGKIGIILKLAPCS